MKKRKFTLILLLFATSVSCSKIPEVGQAMRIIPKSDSTALRSKIIKILEAELGLNPRAQEKGSISQQKKFKIYGSNETFHLVEFTYTEESLAEFLLPSRADEKKCAHLHGRTLFSQNFSKNLCCY